MQIHLFADNVLLVVDQSLACLFDIIFADMIFATSWAPLEYVNRVA